MGIQFLSGLALGYDFILAKRSKEEVEQGAHSILITSYWRASQATTLVNVIYISMENYTSKLQGVLQIFSSAIELMVLLGMPAMTLVKEGSYPAIARYWNDHLIHYRFPRLPDRLSGETHNLIVKIVNHFDQLIQVGVLMGSFLILKSGKFAFALGVIGSLAYELGNGKLFSIPRNVSVYVDFYMPIVISVVKVLKGTWISSILNSVSLLTYYRPFNFYLQHQANLLVRHILDWKGITMEEVDAPWEKNKNLTFEEIRKILDANDSEFEINPAHCSKKLCRNDQTVDKDFQKLLDLFNQIDWSRKTALVRAKLKDDDRFLAYLKEELKQMGLEELTNDQLRGRFDFYVQKLAELRKIPVNQFFADWTRQQMVYLVQVLKGELPPKGTQEDLEATISRAEKVLPYLLKLTSKQELEDRLLQMAVEGGYYCPLEMKRVFQKQLDSFEASDLPNLSPMEAYEFKILKGLEKMRGDFFDGSFESAKSIVQQNVEGLAKEQMTTVMTNLHTYDLYHRASAFGIIALDSQERDAINLKTILSISYSLDTLLPLFYEGYQLLLIYTVAQHGLVYFGVYIANLIESLNLTADQKSHLLERFTWGNKNKILSDYTRLMMFMQGILRSKY